jgi:hypothetical protein
LEESKAKGQEAEEGQKNPGAFQKMIFALSASSPFTILFLSPEDRKARRRPISRNGFVFFVFTKKKALRSLRALRFICPSTMEGAEISQSIESGKGKTGGSGHLAGF